MFKRVPIEIKNEILQKVKEGLSISDGAKQYGISTKTIYGWLQNQIRPSLSILEYNRLKRENEELKRIIGVITLELERGKKIIIVQQSHNKQLIAKCMNINNKNIYYQNKKDMKDMVVKNEIEQTFRIHPAYGHRRLIMELKINHKKILRIMHKFNLKSPRLWYQKKFTAQSNPAYQTEYTNLLENINLSLSAIGDIWSSDLTYIKLQGRLIYLAIIQDVVSKEVVGFNLSTKHDSDLVLKTLKEAVLNAGKLPKIFHSDRGREYLSQDCIGYLENNGSRISVSDPGSPWQNGWSESFFSRFKGESGDFNRFEDLGKFIEYVFGYLNYYNALRIHTKIKMSPYQFKQKVSESVLEKRGT